MFDKFCKRFLPLYLRFWPTKYWLAIWSAPVRHDTAWEALRITGSIINHFGGQKAMNQKLTNTIFNTLLFLIAIIGTPIAFAWYGVKGTIQWWRDFMWR